MKSVINDRPGTKKVGMGFDPVKGVSIALKGYLRGVAPGIVLLACGTLEWKRGQRVAILILRIYKYLIV